MGVAELRASFNAVAEPSGYSAAKASLTYERAHDAEWQRLAFAGTGPDGVAFSARSIPLRSDTDLNVVAGEIATKFVTEQLALATEAAKAATQAAEAEKLRQEQIAAARQAAIDAAAAQAIKDAEEAAKTTNRELWRESDDGDSPLIFVTPKDEIGISVGGDTVVRPIQEWFKIGRQDAVAAVDQIQSAELAQANKDAAP